MFLFIYTPGDARKEYDGPSSISIQRAVSSPDTHLSHEEVMTLSPNKRYSGCHKVTEEQDD